MADVRQAGAAVWTALVLALLTSLFKLALGTHTTSDYTTVYGGVLARDVTGLQELFEKELLVYQMTRREALAQSLSDCDKKSRSSECVREADLVLLSYEKQRLYMSKASGRPLKLVYLTEEAGYTQRKTQEAVLGNMFKVSNCFLKQPITRPPHFELGFQMELKQCNIIHNFTLTKTTVKHYYVYSHTWMDVNLLVKIKRDPGYYGNLTIATQNIWHFSHTPEIGYAQRIRELGKVIQNLKADIVAFQEVRLDVNWRKPSQVAHLRHFLPDYQYVYQPAMLDPGHGLERVEEGVAIFSRHAITDWDYTLLSRNHSDPEDSHQRVLLHATVDSPQLGLVHVFTTHLSLSESARKRSVVEICQHMSRYSGPKFLMGDLNSVPNSEEVAYLRGEIPLDGTYCLDLEDVWRESPRYSNVAAKPSDRAGLTFSAIEERPIKRIDYIFMSSNPFGGDRRLSVNVVEVIGASQSGSRAVSDHFGLSSIISSSNS